MNILVIKLGALGDFVIATGRMQAIRNAYPEAHITLLTGTPYLKLAQKSGYFDAFEVDNRTNNPKDYFRICKTILADKEWDYIFDLQISTRTKKRYYSLARLLTKNPLNWALLDREGFKVKSSPSKKRFTWGKTTWSNLTFPLAEPSLSFCYDAYPDVKNLPPKYVLMIPGCSAAHPYKRWPAQFYAQVAKILAEKNIYSIVIGTDAEKNEIETVCQISPFTLNFCNKNKLMDIPDLAHHAVAVIGNDTGPMHMAELTDTPCLTLFSEKTKSAALNRSNVTNLFGKNIEDISPETVIEKLFSVLK